MFEHIILRQAVTAVRFVDEPPGYRTAMLQAELQFWGSLEESQVLARQVARVVETWLTSFWLDKGKYDSLETATPSEMPS